MATRKRSKRTATRRTPDVARYESVSPRGVVAFEVRRADDAPRAWDVSIHGEYVHRFRSLATARAWIRRAGARSVRAEVAS